MTEYIRLDTLYKAFGIGTDCAECPHRTDDCCLESRPTAAICDILGALKPEYRETSEAILAERDYYKGRLNAASAENAKLRAIIDRLREYADKVSKGEV